MRTLGYVICPKCQDLMRTITRGAVHIEQCDNCKGVFLDGGELDQIVAAERDHYARVPSYDGTVQSTPEGAPPPYAAAPHAGSTPPGNIPPGSVPPGNAQPGGAPPPYQPPPGTPPPGTPVHGYPPAYPPGYYDQGHYGHHRRRSFLEELLD